MIQKWPLRGLRHEALYSHGLPGQGGNLGLELGFRVHMGYMGI